MKASPTLALIVLTLMLLAGCDRLADCRRWERQGYWMPIQFGSVPLIQYQEVDVCVERE